MIRKILIIEDGDIQISHGVSFKLDDEIISGFSSSAFQFAKNMLNTYPKCISFADGFKLVITRLPNEEFFGVAVAEENDKEESVSSVLNSILKSFLAEKEIGKVIEEEVDAYNKKGLLKRVFSK